MTFQSTTIGTTAPTEFENLKTLVENIQSANELFFGLLKTQARFAKATIIDVLHPQVVAINATCDQILSLIDDIDMGPVRYIMISPHTYGVIPKYDRLTGQLALSTLMNMAYLASAMTDEGDIHRPAGSGNWGAFIGVVSCYTGDIENILDTLDSIGEFFALSQFTKLRQKIELIINRNTQSNPTESQPPDFSSLVTAELLLELDEALESARSFVEGIKEGSTKAGEVFDLMIQYFDAKESEITQILNNIQKYLDKFVLGIGGTGFYWKFIPVQANGVDAIQSALTSTIDFPSEWSAHDFSVSFMIAGANPIGTIGSILGVS